MFDIFINWSGLINIISGMSLLAFWWLFAMVLPYRQLSSTLAILVKNRYWAIINLLGVCGALLGVLGLSGLYIVQIEQVGIIGLIGFFLSTCGTTLLFGPLLWDTIIWPILVSYDPKLLDFQGPIYQSKTFIPFFITAGVIYSLGNCVLGILTAKVGVLPASGGVLLALGAPLFGMGSMFGKFQVIPRTIGVSLLSIGLMWLGFSMWII